MAKDPSDGEPSLPNSAGPPAELKAMIAGLIDFIEDSRARGGREDACTVCGEWPAGAVRRLRPRTLTEPAILRLCSDCRLLRRRFYAEVYEPA